MYARDMARIATPVGHVSIFGDARCLTSIEIGMAEAATVDGATAPVCAAVDQLRAWFAGALTAFDLPLAPAASLRGGALRAAMVAIGYGETVSYGELAARAGSSPRAIGQACARNPFPIIVPCHRILNASGSLGAYSAGEGPATKQWLIAFERRGRRDVLL